jgi:hypothetical protein
MEEQQRYRYMVAVDGVGCPDRLSELFASSTVVLLSDTDHGQYWQRDLKPYENYLPVAANFSDLASQVAWAERHPHLMKKMLIRNSEYASTFLTSSSQMCYLAVLLDRFSQMFLQGEVTEAVSSQVQPAKGCPRPWPRPLVFEEVYSRSKSRSKRSSWASTVFQNAWRTTGRQ